MTDTRAPYVSITCTTDRSWVNAIVVLVLFGAYHALFTQFGAIKSRLDPLTGIGLVSYVLTYALIGIPIFAGTRVVSRESRNPVATARFLKSHSSGPVSE